MKQDEIIEMARQAGFGLRYEGRGQILSAPTTTEKLEAFAKLVAEATAAKEREACAELIELLAKGWKENPGQDDSGYIALSNAAQFIRARGEA